MFEKENNEEGFMFVFLVVTLVFMLIEVFSSKEVLDLAFLLVVIYYFIKFLVIRKD